MINCYTTFVRLRATGEVVRVLREGYQGWYILVNNKEMFKFNWELLEI